MQNTINISHIEDFTQQIIGGTLILTRIIPFVSENSLFQYNLRGSTLVNCIMNGNKLNFKKYKRLLLHVYSITDRNTILQNRILNISQNIITEKGFSYHEELGMSIQGADTRRTLKEIINMVHINGFNMVITIRMKNGELVKLSISSQDETF